MQYEIYLNNKMIPEDQSVIELENKPSHTEQIEVNIFNFYDLCVSYSLSPEISIIAIIDDTMTISDGNMTISINLSNKIVSIIQRCDSNGIYYCLNIHLFTLVERDDKAVLFPYRSSHLESFNNCVQHVELYMYIKDRPPVYLKQYTDEEFNDKLFSNLKYNVHKISHLKKGDYIFNLEESNIIRINDIKFSDDRIDMLPALVAGENIITKDMTLYHLESLISDDIISNIPSNAYIYNTNSGKLYHYGQFMDAPDLKSYINILYGLKNLSNELIDRVIKILKNKNFKLPDELSKDSCIWIYDILCNDISSIHNYIYNHFKDTEENEND